MSRGRLLFPFRCVFAYLDTEATDAAGYDEDFREPIQAANGGQFGDSTRAEGLRTIRAQIEPSAMNQLHKYTSGDSRDGRITVVTHFAELERLGLVDNNGDSLIRVNDRLTAIKEDNMAAATVLSIPALPGLYVVQVLPIGFGLGKKRNLLQIDLKARPQAK